MKIIRMRTMKIRTQIFPEVGEGGNGYSERGEWFWLLLTIACCYVVATFLISVCEMLEISCLFRCKMKIQLCIVVVVVFVAWVYIVYIFCFDFPFSVSFPSTVNNFCESTATQINFDMIIISGQSHFCEIVLNII